MATTNCTRCKGNGFVFGDPRATCYGCNGKGTRAAQIASRDAAKAAKARFDPREAQALMDAQEARWAEATRRR